MFFVSDAMLMDGDWLSIAHVSVTAVVGVYLLSCAVQGWFLRPAKRGIRVALVVAALTMINGSWLTDAIGIAIALALFLVQRRLLNARDIARGLD